MIFNKNDVLNIAKLHIAYIMFKVLSVFPIKKNKIVVCNDWGRGYGDNAKYIIEALLKRSGGYDIVWAVNNQAEDLPKEIRKVKYKSLAFYYELVTAKVWIDNCRKIFYERKRDKQFYIQTWHGDLGFKRIEKDAEQVLDKWYIQSAKNDSKMINVVLSGNSWFTDVIRRAFWYDGEILECGSPRRDIIYKCEEVRTNLKRKFGIAEDVKLFMYAPTFRAAQDESCLKVYGLEWERVRLALEKRFGGKWKGIARLHPNLAAYYDKLDIPSDVINANDYPDMQELLCIADCCISDYSSCLFEFAVSGKMGFIYAEDLDDYLKDRGIHFNFDVVPFKLTQCNAELEQAILSFDEAVYKKRCYEFYHNVVGTFDDGNASEKVADLIEQVCKGDIRI